MIIRDTLVRDPSTHPLVNQGQARITSSQDDRTWDELQAELSTFVCEGQYEDGLQRILSSYLTNLHHTSQKGAWVSGFYGSGKSHLLKMLCHLWQNTMLPGGATARSIVPFLPPEIHALLRELDTQGKRHGGLFAAAGALPSGTSAHVRLTVLGLVLRAAGFPEKYAPARFVLWLIQEGYLDRVRSAVTSAGKQWESELNNLYVSPLIAKALLACDPHLAPNEAAAHQIIKEQFAQPADITTEEFRTTLHAVLALKGKDGKLPCTVLVLDEVQQYIGNSQERSSIVSELAEVVSKQFDSRVMIVAAGQSALSDTRDLQRLMDRFTIRVALSDADVEAVTRKVLLQKKASASGAVRSLLSDHAGEVSRQLAGTRIAESSDDHDIIVDDYPLLPVRRRFWEYCFRQVDLAGTQSQLRSQLSIIHQSVARLSDRALGAVIPADDLFDQLAPNMVTTGVLLREINERIINLAKDGTPASTLKSRLCGLIFLIGRLPREAGADIGVRANGEHLADLLIDDIAADNGKLRSNVQQALAELAADGALLELGGEYRLQTKEGAEWDREFRNRRARFINSASDLQLKVDQLLSAAIDRVVRSIKVAQGTYRESRALTVYRSDTAPPVSDSIPVWVRDQWAASDKEHIAAAQQAGLSSPVVFVFIPKRGAQDLQEAICDAEAARQTLEFKGVPTTDEGNDARSAMEGRRAHAEREQQRLIDEIVTHARVIQGGGSEVFETALADRIRVAAEAAMVRLFPDFSKADAAASAWESAFKRAREGADNPFQPLGHAAAIDQHPVTQQVLQAVGSGKSGSEVSRALRAAPFGWPRDAIDAALTALVRSQHLSATLNGAAVTASQLDHPKIAKAVFRVEQTTLSASDKIAIRKVFQAAGVVCKPGEELAKADEFVQKLRDLARSAGGEPPCPEVPKEVLVDDLGRLAGTELLATIRNRASDLESWVSDWKERARLIRERLPDWEMLLRLLQHAQHVPEAADEVREVDHVRGLRALLAATHPVADLRKQVAAHLRSALNERHQALSSAHASALRDLEGNEIWRATGPADRARILGESGLTTPVAPNLADDDGVLAALDSSSLAARSAEIDAVPGRAQRALEIAARLHEPQVQPVSLERATLRTAADVTSWLGRQEAVLLEALTHGPVLVK